MPFVDINKLKSIAGQHTYSLNAEDTSIVLTQFANVVANMLASIKKYDEKELALLIISFQNWLTLSNSSPKVDPDVRTICLADLGNVYDPESAYFHPVVILEKVDNDNLVLVVPTSTNAYSQAFDRSNNPGGSKYIIKADTSNNFDGTCGLELNNLRVISKGRIICTKKKIDEVKYKEIKDRLIELYFPRHIGKLNLISDHVYKTIEDFAKGDDKKLQEIKGAIEDSVNNYISPCKKDVLISDTLIKKINNFTSGNEEILQDIKDKINTEINSYISSKIGT